MNYEVPNFSFHGKKSQQKQQWQQQKGSSGLELCLPATKKLLAVQENQDNGRVSTKTTTNGTVEITSDCNLWLIHNASIFLEIELKNLHFGKIGQ